MYFQVKTILKNNCNHSPQHTIDLGLSNGKSQFVTYQVTIHDSNKKKDRIYDFI